MVKACIYCNLPSFEEVFPTNSKFDGKKKKTIFAKIASVDLDFFVVVSICVDVIYISYGERTCNFL